MWCLRKAQTSNGRLLPGFAAEETGVSLRGMRLAKGHAFRRAVAGRGGSRHPGPLFKKDPRTSTSALAGPPCEGVSYSCPSRAEVAVVTQPV